MLLLEGGLNFSTRFSSVVLSAYHVETDFIFRNNDAHEPLLCLFSIYKVLNDWDSLKPFVAHLFLLSYDRSTGLIDIRSEIHDDFLIYSFNRFSFFLD